MSADHGHAAVPGDVARASEPGVRLVARNGLFAATQVVLTSIAYLFAYRVMSATVGIEVIGSWSLCLALGSVATLADLGASDGLARTVAQRATASGATIGLRRVLVTGLLACAVGYLVGGGIIWSVGRPLLPWLLTDPDALSTTLSVFAPALAVAGLNALGLGCQAVLEGLERYALRFAAGAVATGVFLAGILLFVPQAGLRGVVWAYVAQSLVLLALSGGLCWRLTRGGAADVTRPGRSVEVLRELVRIGLPVRAMGLMTMLLDPLTRIAVTFFGGTSSAGHYEVASRLVLQLRTVVVAAFQAGLPRLVKLAAVSSNRTARVTVQTYRAGLTVAVAAFTMAVLLGPFVYRFVLGEVPPLGMRFFVMLCAAWCVNAVSAPFFFNLLAKRHVASLWLSSGVMALVNVTLWWPLGRLYGAEGAVAALAMAIAAGSLVTIIAARRTDIAIPRWVHAPELLFLCLSLAAVAAFVGPSLAPGGASAGLPLFLVCVGYGAAFACTLFYSGILER